MMRSASGGALARTILIVDDDAALGRLYAEALVSEGWRIVLERDVAAGLDAFRARPVDMVVLDAHLPSGTGFELAKAIRAEPRGADLPILFISGVLKAARHRLAVLEEFRAVDFLEKPVAPGELAARIRIALGPEVPDAPVPPVEAPLVPTPAASPLPALSLPPLAPVATGGIRGDLSQRPFHDVFAELARTRATGLLAVRRDKVKKIVSLKDGRPVAVKSNLLADCLGRVMVRAGTITEAQCAESLDRMRATNRPQGQVLIELGYATERTLEEALEQQLEQKLYDVFAWESGEFQFVPKAADDQAATVVEVSAARALHEGLVRSGDEEKLRKIVGPVEHLAVRLLSGGAEAVASLANAQELAELTTAMDGTRSLRELLDAKMVDPVQSLSLVATLKSLAFAELAPPRASKAVQRATRPPRRQFGPVDANDPDGLERLQARLEELSKATHYEVLGVPRSATVTEIRRAYVAAARDFHPDKHYAGAPTDLRGLAERVFDRYTQAHTVLTDAEERARYDRANPETPSDRAERILRADEAFRAARVQFDEGHYSEAAARFREATDGYPDEPLFHAWLALALFQANPELPGAAERSLTMLENVRQKGPRLAEPALFAAHIQRARGGEDTAAELLDSPSAGRPAIPR